MYLTVMRRAGRLRCYCHTLIGRHLISKPTIPPYPVDYLLANREPPTKTHSGSLAASGEEQRSAEWKHSQQNSWRGHAIQFPPSVNLFPFLLQHIS